MYTNTEWMGSQTNDESHKQVLNYTCYVCTRDVLIDCCRDCFHCLDLLTRWELPCCQKNWLCCFLGENHSASIPKLAFLSKSKSLDIFLINARQHLRLSRIDLADQFSTLLLNVTAWWMTVEEPLKRTLRQTRCIFSQSARFHRLASRYQNVPEAAHDSDAHQVHISPRLVRVNRRSARG